MLLVKTELKEVDGKGIGLFANEKILKGETIHIDEFEIDKIYDGKVIRKRGCEDFFDKYASYNIAEDSYYLFCRLPQKQYVLKVDKSLNFKNVKDEKKSIHPHTNCQHPQGVR